MATRKEYNSVDQLGNIVSNIGECEDPGSATSNAQLEAKSDSAHAMGVVVHGSNGGAERPSNYCQIIWVGSVEPLNAEDNDIWIDIS